jgi:hypothetical protein
MADAKHTHPAQRDYGVDCHELTAGDVLVRDGIEYRVTEGFDRDTSSCWRQSRYIRCVQLTGGYFGGAIQYVNPVGSVAKATGAAHG